MCPSTLGAGPRNRGDLLLPGPIWTQPAIQGAVGFRRIRNAQGSDTQGRGAGIRDTFRGSPQGMAVLLRSEGPPIALFHLHLALKFRTYVVNEALGCAEPSLSG